MWTTRYNVGYVYTFDIHEKLKDTLNVIDYINCSGFAYDQKRKVLFGSTQNGIEARDLDGNLLVSKIDTIYNASAVAQTAEYIYVAVEDYIYQYV